MIMRVGMICGALGGWAASVVLVVVDLIDHDKAVMVQAITLSVALICSACLALQRHQRPLGSAYELGYDMGRRDAIREATQRSNVSPIRRAKGALSEFSRREVGV